MKNYVAMLAFTVAFGAAPAIAAELPKSLVEPYLQIQAALANDKFGEVAVPAKAVEAAATTLGKDAEALAASAKKLSSVKTIEAARTAFGEVSDALVAYADKTKSELGADLHVAYCPMVNKPWVQKGEEIKNPYYGQSMLTCGMIKK